MLPDREDKLARARRALEFYVKQEGMVLPGPDGEEDRQLDAILDRLAVDLLDLAGRYSESAAWMRWASEAKPPPWAVPFLTQAEIEGKGPPVVPAPPPEPEPPPPPKKGRGRKKKPGSWMSTPPLDPALVQAAIDHYDDLPTIAPTTGQPYGLVGMIDD